MGEKERSMRKYLEGSVAEWLERLTCNSEVPSSSLAIAASWICFR